MIVLQPQAGARSREHPRAGAIFAHMEGDLEFVGGALTYVHDERLAGKSRVRVITVGYAAFKCSSAQRLKIRPVGILRMPCGVGLPGSIDRRTCRFGGVSSTGCERYGKQDSERECQGFAGHRTCGVMGGQFEGSGGNIHTQVSDVSGQFPVVGFQWSVSSGQFPVVSFQWSVSSGRFPVVGFQWSVSSGQLPVVSFQWSVSSGRFPVVSFQSTDVSCPYCISPLTSSFLRPQSTPPPKNQKPTTNNQSPITNHQQPKTKKPRRELPTWPGTDVRRFAISRCASAALRGGAFGGVCARLSP